MIYKIGHRANSLARLCEIKRDGGFGAEIDVRLTTTEILVASHDAKDAQAGVPLASLLEGCAQLGLLPLLDIKEAGLVKRLAELMEQVGIKNYRTFSCTTAEVPFYRATHHYLGHRSAYGQTTSDLGVIYDPFGPLPVDAREVRNANLTTDGELWVLDQTLHGHPPAAATFYENLAVFGPYYLVTKEL